MLRNYFKIAICGLISILLLGCSETTSLLNNSSNIKGKFDISIKSEPHEKYRILGIIEQTLPLYIKDLTLYKINIEIKGQTSSAVYTERQVTKEQLHMAAKIQVYDKYYNELGEKLVDVFSTYETCDNLPFSVLASKKQSQNAVLDELANSIIFAIVAIIKSYKL